MNTGSKRTQIGGSRSEVLARIIPPERHPRQPLVDGCQRLLALGPFVARLPVDAAATLDVDVDRFGSSAVTSKF